MDCSLAQYRYLGVAIDFEDPFIEWIPIGISVTVRLEIRLLDPVPDCRSGPINTWYRNCIR